MNAMRNAPCIIPRRDTWRHVDDAASWMWSPRSRPQANDAAELNPWGATQLAALLDALRPIGRVRWALLNGPPDAPPPGSVEHTWTQSTTPHADFEHLLVEAVRGASFPVTTVELSFDLYVWVYTLTDPGPVRGWILSAVSGDLQFETNDPYGALMMDHTLFRDGVTHGDSNAELHRLNRPLLEAALVAIEARLGPIVEVAGLPDVTRTGFASHGGG